MQPHHLAQVNVSRFRVLPGSPAMREFVSAVDAVNALADRSAGFVWRLPSPDAHGAGEGLLFVNVSVWESYEALHAFVYRSAHATFVRRRARWFERTDGPGTALWWAPAGHRPGVPEAVDRLAYLRAHGPSPMAFSVRRRFDPGGRPEIGATTASPPPARSGRGRTGGGSR